MIAKRPSLKERACVLDCGGQDAAFSCSAPRGVPRPPKPIEGYSKLLKLVLKNILHSAPLWQNLRPSAQSADGQNKPKTNRNKPIFFIPPLIQGVGVPSTLPEPNQAESSWAKANQAFLEKK